MLHIHNGDSCAGIAKNAHLPGEHIAWREALICGPTPRGLPADEWRRLRARHLAGAYDLVPEDCEKQLREQDETLSKFSDHEEVVFWFEHDLFCQIHLVYLLNWFAQQDLATTKLGLICIGEFPGIEDFRGLGQLTAEQLTSLFPQRNEVTAAQMKLARRAWAAYSSPDPREIATLLAGDTSALSFLDAALQKHLARFPSLRNGLGEIENKALELIAAGASRFGSLFQKFGKAEPIYGLGDAQFMLLLRQLAAAPQPLLTISNGDGLKPASGSDLLKTSLTLTVQGKSVRRGDDDYVALNGIDTWLGGVHLTGPDSAWRWNEQQAHLVESAA